MKSKNYEMTNLVLKDFVNESVKEIVKNDINLSPERIAINSILKAYEEIDHQLFKNHNTTKEYSCGFKNIYIKINNSDVKLSRRYYKDHKNRKYYFLLDNFVGLKSRKELSWELIIKNLKEIITARSYKQASKNVLQNIDPRLISDAIKKATFAFEKKKLTEKVETLYLAMDGQWFGVKNQKGRKHEFKFAVTWTGREQVSKNRFKLVNRQILCLNKMKSSISIAHYLESFINEVYGKVNHIVVIGDGASWITNVARELSYKTTRVIDKYHYIKMITQLFKIVKGPKHSWKLPDILEMSKDDFKNTLLEKLSDHNGELKNWNKTAQYLFKKIIKWFSKFRKNLKLKYAINPIEGIQSHYFAKYFRGQRVFKLENLYKYMNLQCAYLNNWKINFGIQNNIPWMGWDPEYDNWDEPELVDNFSLSYEPEDPHGIIRKGIKVEDPESFGFGGRY